MIKSKNNQLSPHALSPELERVCSTRCRDRVGRPIGTDLATRLRRLTNLGASLTELEVKPLISMLAVTGRSGSGISQKGDGREV